MLLDRATGSGNKISRDKSFPHIDQQTPLKHIQHAIPAKVDSVCPDENLTADNIILAL